MPSTPATTHDASNRMSTDSTAAAIPSPVRSRITSISHESGIKADENSSTDDSSSDDFRPDERRDRRSQGAHRRSGDSLDPLTPQATRRGPAQPQTKHTTKDTTPETRTKSQKYKQWAMQALNLCIDQWFLFGLGMVVLISSQVQVAASQQQIKETVCTYLCIAVIFFISGCTLPTRTLIENYSRWKIHLYVQVQCFLMTSATTFAIVSACATNRHFMDPWLLIGLIFLGSMPTTISSNVIMTRKAHGNTALTVVQSTIGNFMAPFISPLLINMYTSSGAWYTHVLPSNNGGYGEIYKRVFKQLGLSLFLPMFVGQVVQNVFPRATDKVMREWRLSKLSSGALLIIIWQTFDQAFESGAFASVKGNNMVFVVFISIAMFMLWLAIVFFSSLVWLPKADVIATAYCVPAKTPAMGVPLSSVMYVGLLRINESKLQIPIIIFQGLQIAAGSILTLFFRKWIDKDNAQAAADRDVEAGRGGATAGSQIAGIDGAARDSDIGTHTDADTNADADADACSVQTTITKKSSDMGR